MVMTVASQKVPESIPHAWSLSTGGSLRRQSVKLLADKWWITLPTIRRAASRRLDQYTPMGDNLGVETQRQWSALAIARTTPAWLGLYSLITVLAHRLAQRGKILTRRTAWYHKPRPTFSDALAAVRFELWRCPTFHTSTANRDIAKLPITVLKRFAFALCYST
jgi:hypothetical protein